jgi:hypothetical protein
MDVHNSGLEEDGKLLQLLIAGKELPILSHEDRYTRD